MGKLETRAEYEANHLPADIEFESQVTGKRSPWKVTFQGATAWVIATTEYDGTLMVCSTGGRVTPAEEPQTCRASERQQTDSGTQLF